MWTDYPDRVSDPIPFTKTHRLGSGAGGEVWLAAGPDGPVALKFAATGRSLSAEIGALARVRHPNVPALLAADRHGMWFARRFVEGARLTSWAHGRSLDSRLDVFEKIAASVHALHAAGVIHGDLSPVNVLVDEEGEPQLLDVGADTRGGALGWMAPERVKGEPPSIAADVFGLGALLYALCAGRPPYERSGAAALGFASGSSLPLPPSATVFDVPGPVEELALRALAWTPLARPAAAVLLFEGVRQGRSGLPLPAVIGMLDERERLRRAVVEAARGECVVAVVHGPRGSGRLTLLRECARAAQREGLLVREMPVDGARGELAVAGESTALLIDADGADADAIRDALDVATEASLVLVRADVPVRWLSRRGALHVRPVALSAVEVGLLAASLGVGTDRVNRGFERSQGRPGVAVDLLRGEVPGGEPLTRLQERLVSRLEQGGTRLPELAALTNLTEHHVLDALEPLMLRGMVWSTPEGSELFACRVG
ncbi:MAG: serine/threonine-protein kinase PknK [Myxococcales bacterium]|nr:serine/threonine-protein kinase PknK [Myxococcales bacterium]